MGILLQNPFCVPGLFQVPGGFLEIKLILFKLGLGDELSFQQLLGCLEVFFAATEQHLRLLDGDLSVALPLHPVALFVFLQVEMLEFDLELGLANVALIPVSLDFQLGPGGFERGRRVGFLQLILLNAILDLITGQLDQQIALLDGGALGDKADDRRAAFDLADDVRGSSRFEFALFREDHVEGARLDRDVIHTP